MYANVVVGVDGEQGGRDAAALAATLAEGDASIALVAVTTSDYATGLQFDLAGDACRPGLFSDERRWWDGRAQLIGVAATSVTAGLESVALQRLADLIVVGRSRRHGIVRPFARDDVRSIMHQTPCAMAVAPANYADDPEPIARIGVAYDGSPESDVALAQAGRLAGSLGVHLRLCHVGETPIDPVQPLLRAAGLEVDHVYGSVDGELVAFGDRVGLLICGSRHDSPLRRIAFGPTSDHLARHLSIPLVVAPTIDTTSIELWQRAGVTRSSDRQIYESLA
jgi:nucleotide-binding universal stress UspA family protein